jgi:hypothetical protein
MSWVVFLIALVPAIGVVVVAKKTRSKGAVSVAAIVAAGLGLLTGNPAYIGIDLFFVGIATFISWEIAKSPVYRSPDEIAAAQEIARLERIKAEEAAVKRKQAIAEFFQAALVLGAIVFVIFWKFWQPSAPQANGANATTQLQPQPVAAQPARAAIKPEKAKKVNSKQSTAATQRSARKAPPTEMHPVEKCLTIPDEQGMVRCLERAQ